jgi:hypothetical protein
MTQSYGALRIVSDTQKIYGVCTCTHAHLLTRSNEDGSSALFTLSAWARRLTSLKRKRCARKGLDSAVTSELTWVPTEGTSWDNELSWGAVIPLASMSPFTEMGKNVDGWEGVQNFSAGHARWTDTFEIQWAPWADCGQKCGLEP